MFVWLNPWTWLRGYLLREAFPEHPGVAGPLGTQSHTLSGLRGAERLRVSLAVGQGAPRCVSLLAYLP